MILSGSQYFYRSFIFLKINNMKIKKLTALFFAIMIFCIGCSVQRNLSTQTHTETQITEDSSTEVLKEISAFIDTTKTSETEIIYTKIEYFEPTENATPPVAENETVETTAIVQEDTSPTIVKNATEITQEKPLTLKNKPAGAIKSITQVNIRKKDEARGIAVKMAQTDSMAIVQKTEEVTIDEAIQEKPTKDPYRWRYIFFTVLIFTITLFILFFYKKFNKIKNVFSIISKKIKIFCK